MTLLDVRPDEMVCPHFMERLCFSNNLRLKRCRIHGICGYPTCSWSRVGVMHGCAAGAIFGGFGTQHKFSLTLLIKLANASLPRYGNNCSLMGQSQDLALDGHENQPFQTRKAICTNVLVFQLW